MARPYRTRRDERDVFRALAHPVRRSIVSAAAQNTCTFEQLRSLTRRSDATLAGHLRILRQAGVITVTRHGTAVSYRANPKPMLKGSQWLATVAGNGAQQTPHPNARSRTT